MNHEMKIYLKSHLIFSVIGVSLILLNCMSCSSIKDFATAAPSPKTIDINSATMVNFPESWPELKAGMSRQEFDAVPFLNPVIQVSTKPAGISPEKVVYFLGFYEYFFINNSLKEENAKNRCQYFADQGGIYKAFFPVSVSHAKEMLVKSATPLGFTFEQHMPNNISSMAWGNHKPLFDPSLVGDYERYIFSNERNKNSGQPKLTVIGSDSRRGGTVAKMVGGVEPITHVRYEGILYAEFKKVKDGTMVYIETDSRYLVMKSRAKSFAKSILMHMNCMFSAGE